MLTFDNDFIRNLPGEAGPARMPRQVPHAAWSRAEPTPVSKPTLLAWSDDCAALLGIDGIPTNVLAGNGLLPGMEPWAAAYGGHQFGHWAGQLGDGRAISLGEVVHHGKRFEIQLKGAGMTPYSRRADGRAVLRSSLREYLCSEAMHHLGVPTTRALALVATGDMVLRDMFYDGHPKLEPGAIVTRVAPTFVRFGNFELFAQRDDEALLKQLVDWTLRTHYPLCGTPAEMFIEVCRRTAVMIAHWMSKGFVHGVMNTDNFSILGVTIDYGPYGWIDSYDPAFTPNTTDLPGRRYAYGHQPSVALWNLARAADALMPLVGMEHAERGLLVYRTTVQATFAQMMADKLGLLDQVDRDEALVPDLHALFGRIETDWTIFFRGLSSLDLDADDDALLAPVREAFYAPLDAQRESVLAWLRRYVAIVKHVDRARRIATMDATNPYLIPRNYLAQEAIDRAEVGDLAPLHRLLEAIKTPYAATDPSYHQRRPDWARSKPGCSALSCSS